MTRTAHARHRSKQVSFDAFPDGIIEVDSPAGKCIGLTSDRFEGMAGGMYGSYLWKIGHKILISLITSVHPGQGHLSQLFQNIEKLGYKVAVPTPLDHMEAILKAKGFVPHWEQSEIGEPVEVWEKPE